MERMQNKPILSNNNYKLWKPLWKKQRANKDNSKGAQAPYHYWHSYAHWISLFFHLFEAMGHFWEVFPDYGQSCLALTTLSCTSLNKHDSSGQQAALSICPDTWDAEMMWLWPPGLPWPYHASAFMVPEPGWWANSTISGIFLHTHLPCKAEKTSCKAVQPKTQRACSSHSHPPIPLIRPYLASAWLIPTCSRHNTLPSLSLISALCWKVSVNLHLTHS